MRLEAIRVLSKELPSVFSSVVMAAVLKMQVGGWVRGGSRQGASWMPGVLFGAC